MKTDARPYRFINEFTEEEAEDIAEALLDSHKFKDDLIDFLRGNADPQQYLYEIQIRIENEAVHIAREQEEARRDYATDRGIDERKGS